MQSAAIKNHTENDFIQFGTKFQDSCNLTPENNDQIGNQIGKGYLLKHSESTRGPGREEYGNMMRDFSSLVVVLLHFTSSLIF